MLFNGRACILLHCTAFGSESQESIIRLSTHSNWLPILGPTLKLTQGLPRKKEDLGLELRLVHIMIVNQ